MLTLAGLLLAGVLAAGARAATVVNGSFETGNFSGWTEQDQTGGSGSWFVYTGTHAPLSALTVPAPPDGTHAAITDQTNPGSHILYQDIALEAGSKHTLSLFVYYHSYASLVSPPSLDYTVTPNQQYRIDVMKPGAPVTSVAASDILLTVFHTMPGDPTNVAPTVITVDLSAFAGQTVRLRMAEVDNQDNFNAGVDGVKIASTPAATTLPASGITTTGATLHGSANPAGAATTCDFQYGTTTAYGKTTPSVSVGSDSTVHAVSATIGGLSPGTTYHFRIVCTNANGTTNGADRTFTTAKPPPKPLKLTVSPHSATAGHSVCYAFRATSSGRGVGGVTIRFAHHTAHTSHSGRATICVTLRAGTYRARASKKGYVGATARVRVRAAVVPKPVFTG